VETQPSVVGPAERRPIRRPRLLVVLSLLSAFTVGWWVGGGVGPEFSGWWNRNAGFATFITGLLVFAATVGYVTLTYQLVRDGKQSIEVASAANRYTLEALHIDRRVFVLTLKGRIDDLLPMVSVHLVDISLVQGNGLPLGPLSWTTFAFGTYRLVLVFEVINHGPTAAVLSLLHLPADDFVVVNNHSVVWRPPTVIAAGTRMRLQYQTTIDGETIQTTWDGRRVVELTLKTTSVIDEGSYDEHAFWLSASVAAQKHDFSASASIVYDHSGEQFLSIRRYSPELERLEHWSSTPSA
jgi:hypothetical protein